MRKYLLIALSLSGLLLAGCHKDKGNDFPAYSYTYDKTKSANCYVVTPNGTLTFAAVEGNTTTAISGAYEAAVLWETNNTTSTVKKGSIVKSASYNDGKVTVKMGPKEGNAVVAVEDSDGAILWSWHIWVTRYSLDDKLVSIGTSFQMMDRNLGALTADADDPLACGLIYYAARKDPFPGLARFQTGDGADCETMSVCGNMASEGVLSADLSGDLDKYMTANPTQFVFYGGLNGEGKRECTSTEYARLGYKWYGSSKVKSDPCPFGYRVMHANQFNTIATNKAEYFHETYLDRREKYAGLWFPYAGYSNQKGILLCRQSGTDTNLYYSGFQMYNSSTNSLNLAWIRYNSDGTGTYLSYFYTNSNASYTFRGASVRCVKM